MQVNGLDAIPSELIPVLAVLVVVQLAVQIVALVSLVRRPAEQVRGPKWAWALGIVLLSNLALGAILYFVIGRQPQAAAPVGDAGQDTRAVNGQTSRDAVDVLYGGSNDE